MKPTHPLRNKPSQSSNHIPAILAGVLLALCLPAIAADKPLSGDHVPTGDGDLVIHPIHHATLVLGWKQLTVYVDPVGEAQRYAQLPAADLILITHAHGDHFSLPVLKTVATPSTVLVAPPSVADQMPPELRTRTTILTNGQSTAVASIQVEAIAACNLTADRLKFHPRGRDVGYVLTLGGKRVYLSGDTEDIPEMRALKNIDVAFLCMNLPYTMTVGQAADAVREFRPKIVYPYHSRGSDLAKFQQLVGTDAGVEVRIRDWYPAGP